MVSQKAEYFQPEGCPQACSHGGIRHRAPHSQEAVGPSPAELTSVGCAGTAGSPGAAAERAGPPVP